VSQANFGMRDYGQASATPGEEPRFPESVRGLQTDDPNSIQGRRSLSRPAATRQALGNGFRFEPRGPLDIKGKGPMEGRSAWPRLCGRQYRHRDADELVLPMGASKTSPVSSVDVAGAVAATACL
jgi:hypothetical protein